ncbi:hypothetical protein [Noviherbaspirillum sp.]|uniref:hypothetical protein n=1 Tax=Noviherbaspirillum sp. TaxID=1926288 RepID=UPI002D621E0F|nr:hypothetical protein [Noviherbaspirillum sp.]HZW21287.1 hypothetical protein [Noviherbaspirillum sp.]
MTAIRPFLFPAALAAILLHAPASAADDARLAEIEARYQRERGACEQAQDKSACLREAAAAREAARRGVLDTGQGSYEQNALARCANLPVEERELCVRRTRGEGVTQGSVSEGGVIREYREYTLPSPPPPAGTSVPPR